MGRLNRALLIFLTSQICLSLCLAQGNEEVTTEEAKSRKPGSEVRTVVRTSSSISVSPGSIHRGPSHSRSQVNLTSSTTLPASSTFAPPLSSSSVLFHGSQDQALSLQNRNSQDSLRRLHALFHPNPPAPVFNPAFHKLDARALSHENETQFMISSAAIHFPSGSDVFDAPPSPLSQRPRTARKAIAILNADGVKGTVTFFQQHPEATVTVNVQLKNLTAGPHGFHVHAFGDLTGGCATTAGHFNPFEKTHGAPDASVRHVGDLGNIIANNEGEVNIEFQDSLLTLFGDNSILGRAVVVHTGEDDLGLGVGSARDGSLKTGNAGGRVGCAIIGLADIPKPTNTSSTAAPPSPSVSHTDSATSHGNVNLPIPTSQHDHRIVPIVKRAVHPRFSGFRRNLQ